MRERRSYVHEIPELDVHPVLAVGDGDDDEDEVEEKGHDEEEEEEEEEEPRFYELTAHRRNLHQSRR